MSKKKEVIKEEVCEDCGEVHYNFEEKLTDLVAEACSECSFEEIIAALELEKLFISRIMCDSIFEEEKKKQK
jgi:hypothetical protein